MSCVVDDVVVGRGGGVRELAVLWYGGGVLPLHGTDRCQAGG